MTVPPNELSTAALVERAHGALQALAAGRAVGIDDLACLGHALDRLRHLSAAEAAPQADALAAGLREGQLRGAAEQSAKDLALAERLVDALRSEHRIAHLSTGPRRPAAEGVENAPAPAPLWKRALRTLGRRARG